MDNARFDTLVKRLASGADRRSLLKGLLGLGGGVAIASHELGDASAARRTSPPEKPTPTPLACPSGSTKCGPECCTDGTSMCCDGACCIGFCYGEELCCPTPREYCTNSNTCCAANEKCCVGQYCYDHSTGACCQDDDCPNGGKCCNAVCYPGPNACCGDFDCPSGDVCTDDNQCCKTTCTPNRCDMDGCGQPCPCPDGYTCLSNGTCAKRCEAGTIDCEQHWCGSCMVDADASDAYCGVETHGAACSSTEDCPSGQFCTLLDPPSHCIEACYA